MGNEYTPHYAGKSHRELYDQLMAGDPHQVDGVAADWHRAETTARHIASEIDKDLKQLDWAGDAGKEYRYRLGLVSGYSTHLADDQRDANTAVTGMASSLRTAQQHADNPDDTDDNDSMWGGAALGGAALGPAGALVGGWLGHKRDEEQKQAAQERMVTLMSNLAADYAVSGTQYHEPLAPPVGLPGGDPDNTGDPDGGPHVHAPRTGPGVNPAGNDPATESGPPPGVSDGPGTGDGTFVPINTGDGTSLVGVDGVVIGAGGLTAGAALAGQVALTGAGGAGGLTAGATAFGATATLASSLPVAGLVTPPGGATGTEPGGLPRGGVRLDSTARPGTRAAAGRGGANARNGAEDEDEETYDTWLTEDDMEWGTGDDAPPPVLGGGTGGSEPSH